MEGTPTNSEKPKNTLEVCLEELRKVPNVPAAVRNTLGKENVLRFIEIATSDSAVEAEALCLAGDLKLHEASQYWYASGEFTVSKSEISLLASKIATDLKPQLVSLIKKEIKGYKNEGVSSIFRSLMNLTNARYSVFSKNLSNYHFQLILTTIFYLKATAEVAVDVVAISEDHSQPEAVREMARAIIRKFDAESESVFGSSIDPEQLYSDESWQTAHLTNKENLKQLDGMLDYKDPLSDEERKKLLMDNDISLDSIRKDHPYKKIPPCTLHKDHPQVFFGEIGIEDLQYEHLKSCFVRINFSDETIPIPTLRRDPRVGIYSLVGIRQDGVIDFGVDPMTGDLMVNQLIMRTLEQVLSSDRYLCLKHYILEEFATLLKSKESDIEDFFDKFEPIVSQQEELEITPNEDVLLHESIELVSNELDIDGKIPTQDLNTQVDLKATIPEHTGQLTKHAKNLVMRAIQSARAEDILQAMRTLCGAEARIAGSHHIFKSPRTGAALTLPRHSRADKKGIAFRLVLENLKISGYSLLEFTDALGVKLPKDSLE